MRALVWLLLFVATGAPFAAVLSGLLHPSWIAWTSSATLALIGLTSRRRAALAGRALLAIHGVVAIATLAASGFAFVPRSLGVSLLLGGVWFAISTAHRRPTPMQVLVAVNVLSLSSVHGWISFKLLNDPHATRKASRAADVRVVPVFGNDEAWLDLQRHGNLRFAVREPRTGRILVGARGGPRGGAYWFDEHDRSWSSLPVKGAGDNALVIPDRDLVAVPDWTGNAVVLGSLTGSPPRAISHEAFTHPRILAWDERRERVVMIDEASLVWQLERSGTVLGPPRAIPDYCDWISYDPIRDEIVASQSDAVWFLDARDLAVVARTPVTQAHRAEQELDVRGRRLFRLTVEKGQLDEIDLDRRLVLRSTTLGFGTFHPAYDAAHDVLLTANYATGWLTFRRGSDLSVIERRYVGHRGRHIATDSEHRILLTSAAGLVELELPPSSSSSVASGDHLQRPSS